MNINKAAVDLELARRIWNKTRLAQEAGITRQQLSVILNRGKCSTVNAGRIASALEVDVSKITEGE